MLCDRCALNGECKHFQPKEQCVPEKRAFEKVVSKLIDEFELESVADRILVERAAMYLIRIARAEAYEVIVGLSENSALWGATSADWITHLEAYLMTWLRRGLSVNSLRKMKRCL